MIVYVLIGLSHSVPGFSAILCNLGVGIHGVDAVHIFGVAEDFVVVEAYGIVLALFSPRFLPGWWNDRSPLFLPDASTIAYT